MNTVENTIETPLDLSPFMALFDEAEAAKARESFLAEWAALPKAGDVE